MYLKEIINKSVYGTIGYIASQDDINNTEQYILYNLPVLREFRQIIIATNWKKLDFQLMDNYTKMWKRYFMDCIIINSEVNRGHNHGYADLDNLIFDYCKENNLEWLCKSANDTLIQESIFLKKIDEADFYYLNGVGLGSMSKYNFDFDRIISEEFFPQTNFYFINTSKVDYLTDKNYLDETYLYLHTLKDYNGKIWEHIAGWECEGFLNKCIIRNQLSKYHLIPPEKYNLLLNFIKDNNIHDPSHKNILIEGICHFHSPNIPITQI
jgi:hypothetical protein